MTYSQFVLCFIFYFCSQSMFHKLFPISYTVAKLSYKRLYKLTIQASLTLSYLVYLVTKSALYESHLLQLLFTLIKGVLSGLRQFLTIESPLKKMKNTSYLTLKALFVLKIFNFLF